MNNTRIFVQRYKENKGLYTASDVEILIATMNRENLDFLEAMFPFSQKEDFSILIINQSLSKTISTSPPGVRVINSKEFGLSKSRNLALKHATGKLAVIADDDVVFLPDFIDKIIEGFTYYKDASCIQFCSETSEGVALKKYKKHPIKNLSWLELLNVFSIELVVKPEELSKHALYFDERFGLGTSLPMGEEQVFMGTLKKKGFQISYYPNRINKHDSILTHEKVSISEKYQVQGAMGHLLFGKWAFLSLFLKIFFDVKQKTLKLTKIKTALKASNKGKLMIKTLKK